MVHELEFSKESNPEVLHKQLTDAGFSVQGIVYDSGKGVTTVILDESETKDPTTVVNSYVYTVPTYPDYPKLYSDAQKVVNQSLSQYNTAAANYVTALGAWNSAGASVTSGNALTKLAACENMVVACASAIEAAKNSIAALVAVVTVMATERNLTSE